MTTPTNILENYRARFEAMIEELKADKRVRMLNAKIQSAATKAKLDKAEKVLGGPLPVEVRAFYEQCNGLSLVWSDHGDADVPANVRSVSGFLGPKHHMLFDVASPKNGIVILPVEQVFAPAPSIPFGEDGELHILGEEVRREDIFLRIADMVDYVYMTGLYLHDGQAKMVLSNDHAASWMESIGVGFADYLEFVLATRGSIAARVHFMEHAENWATGDFDSYWTMEAAKLRAKPTPKSLEARRKDEGDEAVVEELIALVVYPKAPVQAYCLKTLPTLEVDFEPQVPRLRKLLHGMVSLEVAIVTYGLIPQARRDVTDLNSLIDKLSNLGAPSDADAERVASLFATAEPAYLLEQFSNETPHVRELVVQALVRATSSGTLRNELLDAVAQDEGYLDRLPTTPPNECPYESQAGRAAVLLMRADASERHLDALAHAITRANDFVTGCYDLLPETLWVELVDHLMPPCLAAAPHSPYVVWWANMLQLPLTSEQYQALLVAGQDYQLRFTGPRPVFDARVAAAVEQPLETLLPWLRSSKRSLALGALSAHVAALREWVAQDDGYVAKLSSEGRPTRFRTEPEVGLAALALARLDLSGAPIDALARAAVEDGLVGATWYDNVPSSLWNEVAAALVPTDPTNPSTLQARADAMAELPISALLENLERPTLGVREASILALKTRHDVVAALTEMTQEEAGYLERFCAEGPFIRPGRAYGIERRNAMAAIALWLIDPHEVPDEDALGSALVNNFFFARSAGCYLPDELWAPLAERLLKAYRTHEAARTRDLRDNLLQLPLTEEAYAELTMEDLLAFHPHVRKR